MVLPNQLRRVPGFLVGGGLVALFGMIMLYVEVQYLHIDKRVAFTAQLVVTLGMNFYYNRFVTWRDCPATNVRRQMGMFLATRGASQLGTMVLFTLLVSAAVNLHYMAANVVCIAAATAVNFYTSDKLVFAANSLTHGRGISMKLTYPFRAFWGWICQQATLSSLGVGWLVVGVSVYTLGLYTTLMLATITTAFLFTIAATVEICWRLYGRRSPEAFQAMTFPEPTTSTGHDSFDLIVCAVNEAEVIRETLVQLAEQTHPNVRIIVSLVKDPSQADTMAEAEAARDLYPDRILVLTRTYLDRMKPHQLATALKHCTADYVGVFDAEDHVAPDLLVAVEAAFQTTGADVVQGPVQLMNLGSSLRDWFCVHNVLEYFFWFSSRMMFQARHGFVPLGGNTVFIRRELLQAAGGWPVSLTEDCALGVKLCSEHGAKVVAYYAPDLTTHEETPDNVKQLVKQRMRWDTGFGAELMQKRWWQLPSLRQRVLAWYILATPFLQAATGILLPLALLSVVLLRAPVGLAMITFVPYIPILLTLFVQLVGLREFGQMYGKKVRLRHYAFLIIGFYPYQLVLAWAALRAVWRLQTNNMTWDKTAHSNKHRVPATLTIAEEVA